MRIRINAHLQIEIDIVATLEKKKKKHNVKDMTFQHKTINTWILISFL